MKQVSILTPELPILIVDDSAQFASVLKKMLTAGIGYSDVTLVDNTEDAYELLKVSPNRFGLMFVDFRFPNGKTGGDLLERLNAEGLMENTVSFMITSEPTSENIEQARKAGAMGVVAKPFNREELHRQLKRADAALRADQIDYF